MMAMISSGRYCGRKILRQGCFTCRAYCMVGVHTLSKKNNPLVAAHNRLKTMMIVTVAWSGHQAVPWHVKLRPDSSDGK